MSRIRANKITNKLGTGAVEFEKGAHLPVGMGITGAGASEYKWCYYCNNY